MSAFDERDEAIVCRAGDDPATEDGASTCICGVLEERTTSGG